MPRRRPPPRRAPARTAWPRSASWASAATPCWPPHGRPGALGSGEAAGRGAARGAGPAARDRAGERRRLLLDLAAAALRAGEPALVLADAPQSLEAMSAGRA